MDGTAALARLRSLVGGACGGTAAAREADGPYACLGCEVTYEVQHHVCPECGGFSVEARTETITRDGAREDGRERDGTAVE
ncbi:hypothetical protein [Halobellus sp. GM3]|uniref:hypothetical protein n=1 Tax=Halobellus sp. GM3 TaxID=3458410 RepID=UPI00403D9484